MYCSVIFRLIQWLRDTSDGFDVGAHLMNTNAPFFLLGHLPAFKSRERVPLESSTITILDFSTWLKCNCIVTSLIAVDSVTEKESDGFEVGALLLLFFDPLYAFRSRVRNFLI